MTVIGYTTGVFDMFHIGHLRVLEQAKDHCDELIVGVTTDELSTSEKGKSPVIPYAERSEIVAAIRGVSKVVPQTSMDKWEAWHKWRFDRMFVGSDWQGTPKWIELEKRFSDVDVEIVYFPYTTHTSSTLLRKTLELLHGGPSSAQ